MTKSETAAVEFAGIEPVASEAHSGVESFSRSQVAALLVIGVISGMVAALQPLLLGGLAAEGRITMSEIGQTAMLEALGMAVASAVAGAFFRHRRLRLVIMGAAIVSILANAASMVGSHQIVLLSRSVNGLSAGLLLWVWVGMLTRIALPARLIAIYATIQAAALLGLSALLSTIVLPKAGAAGGYACLMGASAVVGLLALLAPHEYRPRANVEGTRVQVPGGRGLAGLLAVALHLAAIMAFWVYLVPLGKLKGLAEAFIGLSVSIALASQIAAGLCAVVLARLDARLAIYGSLAGSLLGLALIGSGSGQVSFVLGVTLVAFFWMFAPPYQISYLLKIDASGRAAIQMVTAQLLGLAAGPALVSFAVANGDVSPALFVSAALYGATGLLMLVTLIGRPTSARNIAEPAAS